MEGPAVDVYLAHDAVCVSINGILHISVKRSQLFSMQSYKFKANYTIEFVSRHGGIMQCDYETESLWLAILAGLDELNL